MKTRNGKILGEQVMLEGLMTLDKLETGQRTLDFQCCEDVQAEAFTGSFKVQGMRDGNLYMTQKPGRKRNSPLFREDDSSLSFGQNRRYYYSLSLDEEERELLPEKLVSQAVAIAMKFCKKYGIEFKPLIVSGL